MLHGILSTVPGQVDTQLSKIVALYILALNMMYLLILCVSPRCLTKNSNAEVVIHTYKPVCVELYKDYKDLGRFMLRYGSETIAAGIVTEVSFDLTNSPAKCK